MDEECWSFWSYACLNVSVLYSVKSVSASQSISQSVSQSVSQSIGQSVSQSVGQSVTRKIFSSNSAATF